MQFVYVYSLQFLSDFSILHEMTETVSNIAGKLNTRSHQ